MIELLKAIGKLRQGQLAELYDDGKEKLEQSEFVKNILSDVAKSLGKVSEEVSLKILEDDNNGVFELIAAAKYRMYIEYRKVGFKPEQAFELIKWELYLAN